MSTEYADFDPEYRARIFLARKKLLGSLEDPSQIPESGLYARRLLNPDQMNRVAVIRQRRLNPVIKTFKPD